jgi:acetyl-CoA acetyltransferase family protein
MTERIAIAGGIRTPYARMDTVFKDYTAVDLGRMVAAELIARTGIDAGALDSVIVGNVAQPVDAVNVARVIALMAGIPEQVPAYTVHRNCASGIQSVVCAAQAIATDEAELVLAAGVESMTQIPLFFPKNFKEAATRFGRAKNLAGKLAALAVLRPRDFFPRVGLLLGLTDPTCGLNMGETAEVLAREMKISRENQDALALSSHQRTVAAQKAGRFRDEIMPIFVPPDFTRHIDFDNGVRTTQSMEMLAKLQPVFDRKFGTVTAGNSSQITDGAAAVLVAGEKAVTRYGLTPLGYIRGHVMTGLTPKRMGLGPAYATSLLLEKTGVRMADIGLIEMNEAFAAQIIANEMVFGDDKWSEHFLKRRAMGQLDRQLLNVNGGAIAMGHPVGSSGTRMILTLLLEMQRRSVDLGLATLCVGGGQGAAILLEKA